MIEMIETTEIGTVIVITDQEAIDAMIAIKKNKKAGAGAGAKAGEAGAEVMTKEESLEEKAPPPPEVDNIRNMMKKIYYKTVD